MIGSTPSPTFLLSSLLCCLMASALSVPPNQSLSGKGVIRRLEETTPLLIAPDSTEPSTFQVGGTQSASKSTTPLLSLPPFLGRSRNQVQCQASLYGRPNYESCATAWEDMPDENHLEKFGNRANAEYNVMLPFRFISRDGTCVIDIEIRDPGASESSTGQALKMAALDIMTKCLHDKGVGGAIGIIKGNRHLSMTIQEYKPNVACSESTAAAANISACQQVLNHMPADTRSQRFGPRGTPNIDVELPRTFTHAGQEGCAITVAMTGSPVYAEWRDIWATAIGVTGMCVVQEQNGKGILHVGRSAIEVNITKPEPSMASITIDKPSAMPIAVS